MKKAALFVEGHTELILARKLIKEIGGASHVALIQEQLHGQNILSLSTETIAAQRFLVLIVNCCNDAKVASAIKDRHATLAAQGYTLVLGLRDLFPLLLADLATLQAGLATVLPQALPECRIIVAVSEIEAWFIQEGTHFPRVEARCTPGAVKAALGFDYTVDSAEMLPHPSASLDIAYRIGGKRYDKKQTTVATTVEKLDYEQLYLNCRARLPSLNHFVTEFENFFT